VAFYPKDALRAFAERTGCRLAIVFGSAARRDGEWAASAAPRDLDVALDYGGLPTPEERLSLIGDLQALVDPIRADVVFLHVGTSPVLRFEIFRGGEPLFEKESGLFVAETVRALALYEDALPFRRARERLLLEGRPS
jgi:hypothetical protein